MLFTFGSFPFCQGSIPRGGQGGFLICAEPYGQVGSPGAVGVRDDVERVTGRGQYLLRLQVPKSTLINPAKA